MQYPNYAGMKPKKTYSIEEVLEMGEKWFGKVGGTLEESEGDKRSRTEKVLGEEIAKELSM